MRLQYIAVLAVAASLASADTGVAMGGSQLVAADTVPSKRALRPSAKVTGDEEERAFNWNIKIPESFTNLFKSGTASKITSTVSTKDDQLVKMLVKGESADDAFKTFKLNGDLDSLLTNANLNHFATYIQLLNKANRAAGKRTVTMIGIITKNYGEAAVARMLVKAKSSQSTKDIAANMEAVLVNTWLVGKKPKTSKQVFNLLKIKGPHDPNMGIWIQFKTALADNAKKLNGART